MKKAETHRKCLVKSEGVKQISKIPSRGGVTESNKSRTLASIQSVVRALWARDNPKGELLWAFRQGLELLRWVGFGCNQPNQPKSGRVSDDDTEVGDDNPVDSDDADVEVI